MARYRKSSREGWDEVCLRLRESIKPEYHNLSIKDNKLQGALRSGEVDGNIIDKVCNMDNKITSLTLALAVIYPQILCTAPLNLTEAEAGQLLDRIKAPGVSIGSFVLPPAGNTFTDKFIQGFGKYAGFSMGTSRKEKSKYISRTEFLSDAMVKLTDDGVFMCKRRTQRCVSAGKLVEPHDLALFDYCAVGFVGLSQTSVVFFEYTCVSDNTMTYALSFNQDRSCLTGPSCRWNAVVGDKFVVDEPIRNRASDIRVLRQSDHLTPTITDSEVFKMYEFLTQTEFWCASGPRPVDVEIVIDSVTGIHIVEEVFSLTFTISLEWPLSCSEWISQMGNPDGWIPTWVPPELMIDDVKTQTCISEELKVDRQSNGQRVKKIMQIEADVMTTYELHSFPFDCQKLKLHLSTPEADEVFFKLSTKPLLTVHNMLPPGCGWTLENISATIPEQNCIVAKLMIMRAWRPYVWKVFIVLSMICVMSLTSYVHRIPEDLGDRNAMHVTLFLAGCAYQVVISQDLPKLDYLTILDKYNMFVFASLTLMMATTSAMVWSDRDSEDTDEIHDMDDKALLSFAAVLGLVHLVLPLYCWLVVGPSERRKLQLESKASSLVPTKSDTRTQNKRKASFTVAGTVTSRASVTHAGESATKSIEPRRSRVSCATSKGPLQKSLPHQKLVETE